MDEHNKRTQRDKREKTATTIQVGSRIKSLRTCRGKSQAQTAEDASISTKYLGEIERGEANVSLEIINGIAQALDVSMADIMEHEHERSHAELINEIMRIAPQLKENKAKIAYRILKILID